jgi:hypothetical protein
MNDYLQHPVPHIKHTKALEDAAIAVVRATDALGRAINLTGGSGLDPAQVERRIAECAGWFVDPSFFLGEGTTRLNTINNLILLAELYREHVKAGNFGDHP